MFARIAAFLVVAKPNPYCARCIATSLELDPQSVIEVAAGLGQAEGFERRNAKCTLCGGVKPVISAH
jgi:hypothetical protein